MSRRAVALALGAVLLAVAAVVVWTRRRPATVQIEPEKDELGVRVPWCIHDLACAGYHAKVLSKLARESSPSDSDLRLLGTALGAAYGRGDCGAADAFIMDVRAHTISPSSADLVGQRAAVSRAHWGACGVVLRPAARPVADTDSVQLTMSACEGSCPAYAVTIHGDGAVDYVGDRFVKDVGPRHATIPRAQAARIFELLDTLHADTMGHMGSGIYDAPGAKVDITRGGATTQALDQAYCFSTEGIENGMCFLVGKIEELSGVLTWVQ